MTYSFFNATIRPYFIAIGAFSAMIATILGAFAAHVLKAQFTVEQIQVFQTGVLYQFIHSLALLIVGLILAFQNTKLIRMVGWLFVLGILFFSGSLYFLSFIKIKPLGLITPVGGVCFILGWFFLTVGIYKNS